MARVRRPLIALIALVVAVAIGYAWKAAESTSSDHHLRTVPMSSLPAQVTTTVHLIEDGGPFPYPRNDGVVFHNNERLLPSEPDGYYHEYTVPTPGSPDRGARRVFTARDGTDYYTGDHYESFVIVDVHQ